MIRKIYEVSCDLCGFGLNHYVGFKPTCTDLKKDGVKVIIYNGKIHTYCDECYNKIKRNDNRRSSSFFRRK